MDYYGIKTLGNEIDPPYIWWIGSTRHDAWANFFTQHPHRLPLEEAIRAYEGIGYKSVKLKIEESTL